MVENFLFNDPSFNIEDPRFDSSVLYIDSHLFAIHFFGSNKQLLYAHFLINQHHLSEADLIHTVLNDSKYWFSEKKVREAGSEITLVYGGNHFTFLPKSLYDNAYSKLYLANATLFDENEEFVYDVEYPEFYDTVFLFSLPKLLLKRAEFYYPEHFKTRHVLQNIIETYSFLHQKLAGKFPYILFVYLLPHKMFVCFTEGGEKLLLLNQFEVQSIEDILYFLLSIHQQYEVAQGDTLFILVGMNPHKGRLKSMIERQYPKILEIQPLFKSFTSPALVEAQLSAADLLYVMSYANYTRKV